MISFKPLHFKGLTLLSLMINKKKGSFCVNFRGRSNLDSIFGFFYSE